MLPLARFHRLPKLPRSGPPEVPFLGTPGGGARRLHSSSGPARTAAAVPVAAAVSTRARAPAHSTAPHSSSVSAHKGGIGSSSRVASSPSVGASSSSPSRVRSPGVHCS